MKFTWTLPCGCVKEVRDDREPVVFTLLDAKCMRCYLAAKAEAKQS